MSAKHYTCANCAHYQPMKPDQGECRERSPIIIHAYPTAMGFAWESGWPPTKPELWCGQHKREKREQEEH